VSNQDKPVFKALCIEKFGVYWITSNECDFFEENYPSDEGSKLQAMESLFSDNHDYIAAYKDRYILQPI
jgi:hypothetical protein